jgi:hypothetical protein
MNPRRFATVAAASCGTVVLAGWVVAWLAGFGWAGIENAGAVPIEDRRAPSLTADAEFADTPRTTAMGRRRNHDRKVSRTRPQPRRRKDGLRMKTNITTLNLDLLRNPTPIGLSQ